MSILRPSGLLVLLVLTAIAGCAPNAVAPSSPAATGSAEPSAETSTAPSATSRQGSLVLLGRIVTLDEPPLAEALLIRDGTVVAVGSRDAVLAQAGEDVRVLDLGPNVAYPGFIDAHAHWIGDREYYGLDTAAAAMEAALSRGWTSISEQWVNDPRLDELEALAAADALPLRVDAYLALNEPAPGTQHFGDWYADRAPGPVGEFLRVRGLKTHIDNGWGTIFHWESADLTATISRANQAGWQVSVHAVSKEAHEMALDAFEGAIGPAGPNPLHHRIDHAIQVTDEQLARMVAMDLATVVHLDAAAADWLLEPEYMDHFGPQNAGEEIGWLVRWRDFVEAGLHVAAASDIPWIIPDQVLTPDSGRPVDQIAGGMDGRGRANPETPEWVLEQLLTAEQGLRAVTVGAAFALGDEARRGHLAVGTLGDVTILSGDVTAGTADDIRALEVVATIVGGIVAYCSEPAICGADQAP